MRIRSTCPIVHCSWLNGGARIAAEVGEEDSARFADPAGGHLARFELRCGAGRNLDEVTAECAAVDASPSGELLERQSFDRGFAVVLHVRSVPRNGWSHADDELLDNWLGSRGGRGVAATTQRPP